MRPIRQVILRFLPFTVSLLLGASSATAQGWTSLPNTTLNSVAPVTCGGSTPPAYCSGAGANYDFFHNAHNVIDAWSGAATDTKRNKMYLFGGGHTAYPGNEVYSVDLTTPSSPFKAQASGTAPTISRLTDPSVFNPTCTPASGNADGTPLSMHTYQTNIYLPKSDMMFAGWMGQNYCGTGDPAIGDAWLWNPSTYAWSRLTISGLNGSPSSYGLQCTLDTTAANDSILCLFPNIALLRVNNFNSSAGTAMGANIKSVSGQYAASLVVDPDRKLLFSIGNAGNYPPDAGAIYAWDISTPIPGNVQTWTSSVTGCGDLMGYSYPSVVWDPTIHRIVGYIPRTNASSAANNEVIVFDPGTKTCVAQPLTGGPPASGSILAPASAEQGMFGRFSYFPALGKYLVVNNATSNAATFTLNLTATQGLGASTLTCIDRDGDGYGTGPGCLGPDADDQDATVYTSAQFLAKWNTIQLGLNHLGYNPANIWYLSPTGNNSTGAVNNPALPFATCCGGGKANPAAGDALLYRGGVYNFQAYLPNGTPGRPLIVMSYPGELAQFNSYPSGFNLVSSAWMVVDGMHFHSNGSVAGVNAGSNTNIEFRHIDSSGNEWGMVAGGDLAPFQPLSDFTIEDSVFHDNDGTGSGQHGIYLASHGGTVATNIFVRRNLLFNNDYTGMQFNGKTYNLIQEQNITYNNWLAGFSWEEGVSNSFFKDNVSINDGQGGLVISNYDGTIGLSTCNNNTAACSCTTPNQGAICPYNQMNNLIENYTVYLTGTRRDGLGPCAGGANAACVPAIQVGRQGACTSAMCMASNMGSNTFRNIVVKTNNSANNYPPILFTDTTGPTYLNTTTFDSVLFQNMAYTGVIGYGLGSSYGYAPYTCAQLATMAASSANCINADPKFVAASPSFWNSPSSFNLQLQSSSPAIHAGSAVSADMYDAVGKPLWNPPSIGAYESVATPGIGTPTISIASPSNNSTASGTVVVSANASDPIGVTSVQFMLDGANLGARVSSAPYSFSWNTTTATNASHTLAAVLLDTAGNTTSSATVTVTVNNTLTASPTVSVTSPANGATVSGSVTFSANATSTLSIASVQFKIDGVNFGTPVTVSPFSVLWPTTGAANGVHAVTAVAVDAAGNVGTASAIAVTVNNTISGLPTLGLLGYWNFDENSGTVANDVAGRGYTGSITGATWVPGKINSALNFNGSTNYVVTPNIPLSNAFSISAWVNSTVTNQLSYARIAETLYTMGMSLGTDVSGTKYKFIVNSGIGSTAGCGAAYGCVQGGTITGGWHLVTGTFDGTTAILYVDNAVAAVDTVTAPANTNYPLNIGRYYANNLHNWNGALDEVRLYSRALTGAEVSAIYSYTGASGSSSCDLNGDGSVNNLDVQIAINQALGTAPCTNADLLQTGQCNVVDVQRVINVSQGASCKVGQ